MGEITNGAGKQPGKRLRWYHIAGLILLVLVVLAGGFLIWLTVTEYRPAEVEPASMGAREVQTLCPGGSLRLMSWNTGYCGLGEEADFVMDGGKGANPENPETVNKNLEGITAALLEADADLYLLQEVDRDSSRTFHLNQWEHYEQALGDRETYFAPNYRCKFVPYPVNDPIGAIDSGVATYSRYHVSLAERHSLPVPFSWPIRTANLKRCLLVSRIPLENSDKELVVMNLHLEAYDDGEGKIAQTKMLLSMLQEEYAKGNYVLAGGDFNQVFPGARNEVKETSGWVPGVLEAMPPEWDYHFGDSQPTCRLLNQPYDPESPLTQYYMIDGFIVSPNIRVDRVETRNLDFRFSDHNPVVLDVTLE